MYTIADNGKEIVVEHSEKKTEDSQEDQWNKFREYLLASKSKNKMGKEGPGARYAIYDVEYEAPGGSYGEGTRYVQTIPRYNLIFFPHPERVC